jgi:hypothetical protein
MHVCIQRVVYIAQGRLVKTHTHMHTHPTFGWRSGVAGCASASDESFNTEWLLWAWICPSLVCHTRNCRLVAGAGGGGWKSPSYQVRSRRASRYICRCNISLKPYLEGHLHGGQAPLAWTLIPSSKGCGAGRKRKDEDRK